MPMYAFECESCGHKFDRMVKLADFDEPQACPECEAAPAKRVISKVGFVLKGDNGWPTKANRIKGQMARRRAAAGVRERELKHDGNYPRLAPNVDGERVDTWSEAKKLAKSKGKDTSSYDSQVRQERKG